MSIEFVIKHPEWDPARFLPYFEDKNGNVRRPPNAYFVFMKHHHQYVRTKLSPKTTYAQLNKVLAIIWHNQPDEMREIYVEYAKRLKSLHKEMFPTYGYSAMKRHKQKNEERVSAMNEVLCKLDLWWDKLTQKGDVKEESVSPSYSPSISNPNKGLIPVFLKLADVQTMFPNERFVVVRNPENPPTQLLSSPRSTSERSSKSSPGSEFRFGLSLSDWESWSSPALNTQSAQETEDFFHGLLAESSEVLQHTSSSHAATPNQNYQQSPSCNEVLAEAHVGDDVIIIEQLSPTNARQIKRPKRKKKQ